VHCEAYPGHHGRLTVAGGIGVRVSGLNELVRGLQRAGVEVEDLKGVFSDIASESAGYVRAYVPRRSGKLAGTVRGNRAKSKAVVTVGRARVRYAGPINYGWPARNIRPADFIKKADYAIASRAVAMLDEGIDQLLRQVGLK
jgi:hypothetical protein